MKKVQSVAKYLIEGMRLYIIVLVFLQRTIFFGVPHPGGSILRS
jgi:hypothetical protein